MNANEILLIIIDVQGTLARIVYDSAAVIENIAITIKGLRSLGSEVIWLEQNPDKLGLTVAEVANELAGYTAIPKMAFDACLNERFLSALKKSDRQQIVIIGMESHICVYQTAVGLKLKGYQVQVVVDAVSSRTAANKNIGLIKMQRAGVEWTSVETILYECMQTADAEKFKYILNLIK